MNAYTETQFLRSKWILGIPIALTGLFLYAVIQQVIAGIPFGDKPAGNGLLIVMLCFMIGVLILFLTMRLSLRIDAEGIHYRFFPLHRKYRSIPWHAIADAHIRNYSALYEYGGWGIKGSKNNNSITVSGKTGLQLIFKTGAKTLLGTCKPGAVEEALKQFNPACSRG